MLQKADFFSSECTNMICRRAPPKPVGETSNAPPDPLAAFDGPTSKSGKGKGGEKEEKRAGMGIKKKRGGEIIRTLMEIPNYIRH